MDMKSKLKRDISMLESLFSMEEDMWINFMFITIFVVIGVLYAFKIYDINKEVSTAFTIGTLLLSISEMNDRICTKRIFYLLSLLFFFVFSSSREVMDCISRFYSDETMLLWSIECIFFSMIINKIKTSKEKQKVISIINNNNDIIDDHKRVTETFVEGINTIEKSMNGVISINTDLINALSSVTELEDDNINNTINEVIRLNEDVKSSMKKLKECSVEIQKNVDLLKKLDENQFIE